ncbi:helix-turn-helix domain-containing protein [Ideonella sp.]|uniref:helix-turn-helix transcriptional regulator n=1 Tax=Ideonella sp. TaxID=1929293 RepID=UPI002B4A7749|nr:helix-turn-helix domain-containing protein [Ideonella sp.]HJV70530.1 helix-turn-helix domain-containing protein [Ideonella sp.]
MNLARFSSLVLAWQRLAADAPAEGFRAAALHLLEPHLAFDSAWWGIANPQAGQVSVMQGYLHRLPPEFTEDWWRIADVDALARRCAEQPGITVHDDGSRPGTPAEDAFDARYGLASALSTLVHDEATGLYCFLSLFRGESRPAFSEAERAFTELLVPHLVLAERTHWRLALRRQLGAAGTHQAQSDDAGYLLDASPDFCRALVGEFPAWPGGPLPLPLQPLLRARGGQWQGRRIEIHIEPLNEADRADEDRAAPNACCRILLRARIGHGLTRREETIARAYAAGDSYKEIARQLGLSPTTVRGYLRECYLKLGVSNKAALGGVLLRGAPDATAPKR